MNDASNFHAQCALMVDSCHEQAATAKRFADLVGTDGERAAIEQVRLAWLRLADSYDAMHTAWLANCFEGGSN
jgi:hypothetical protein